MIGEDVQHVEAEAGKSYAQDLCSPFEEGDFTQSKNFLRSFAKRWSSMVIKPKYRWKENTVDRSSEIDAKPDDKLTPEEFFILPVKGYHK